MSVHHRTFRVEQKRRGKSPAVSTASADTPVQHKEVMAELKGLRALLETSPAATMQTLEAHRAQLAELQKLKGEMDIIYEAISRTKQEMATLHVTGFNGPEMSRVTCELGAVVGGTEQATQIILAAAEDIDQNAGNLAASLKSEHERGFAQDIQERVVTIFEACNFQDLTGQRISKVVSTLKFIEQHIVQMIEIWGGIDALREFTPVAIAEREGDAKLINGPMLDEEAGHASQNDIDALFN
jgi:chemotaxis protein CheZ